MEEGLAFGPIQSKVIEPELKWGFNDFCRKICLKWYFRDETQDFGETLVFSTKSIWNISKGRPLLRSVFESG